MLLQQPKSGEVDIRTSDLFGSDGCLSDSGPNSGLKEKNTIAMTIIETVWQNYHLMFTRWRNKSGASICRYDVTNEDEDENKHE